MYNVVLDTNILHQEGLSSNDMSILKNLVEAELVCIHVPYLVAQEFITKRISNIKEESEKIIKALDLIEKEARRINSVLCENKDDIIKELAVLEESIEEKAKSSFGNWVETLRVNILQPEQVDLSLVFNDYFSGSGAFRQVKARDDIPDAFISTSIEKLIESVGEVIVVIKDDKLKRHLEKHEKIITLPSLRDLFNQKGLEETLASERVTRFIISEEMKSGLLALLDTNPHYFEYFNEESDDITGQELIGETVYSISIEMESYNTINDLAISDVRKISSSEFSATCHFTVDTHIGYVTDYVSYLKINKLKGRNPDCWSMSGEGWCDIIEESRLKFFGELTIELKKDFERINEVNVFDELVSKNIVMKLNVTDVHIESLI